MKTILCLLAPRMTSAQRTAIANPATGLLVFDTTTGGFWFYNGLAWHGRICRLQKPSPMREMITTIQLFRNRLTSQLGWFYKKPTFGGLFFLLS